MNESHETIGIDMAKEKSSLSNLQRKIIHQKIIFTKVNHIPRNHIPITRLQC